MNLFTISHRDGRWYVESESGKPMGDYATEKEAKERLREVEAAKAAKGLEGQPVEFAYLRDVEGKVRTGVWDFVCVEGTDNKGGQYTEFSIRTLSEMVDNFVKRGDLIPIDWNHQSNYASQNGMPAPALGFYGALAVVWNGDVIKQGMARDVRIAAINPTGRRNGLYAFRSEVTEKGEDLLPSFKYLSPTFTPEGVDRQNQPVGYCLLAVAATNTPWQSGTEITFENGASDATGATKMTGKLSKLASFVKMDESANDKDIKTALKSYMAAEALKVFEAVDADGDYDGDEYEYEDAAKKLEEMAKLYEEAAYEEEGDEEPAHVGMRKMALKMRKMAAKKMEEEAPAPEAEKAMEEADDKEKGKVEMANDAKLATMEATNKALTERLAKLEAADEARSKAAEKAKQAELEAFADRAVAGGYPKDSRASLIEFARSNFEGARAAVSPFLKTEAPAYLFEGITSGGAPKGVPARDTLVGGPDNRVVEMSALGRGARAIVFGEKLSEAVRDLADSEDPTLKKKVDAEMPVGMKGTRFEAGERYLAAERIISRERPDLVRAASETL